MRCSRARLLTIAAAACLLTLGAGTATARTTIFYDLAATVASMVGPQPDPTHLSVAYDNLYQQGNAVPVLGPERLAAKVSSGQGSLLTPSIAGLDGSAIASVLKDQIDGSASHLVFLDELGPTFQGDAGIPFDQAMGTLAQIPFGAESYADHVHVYVRAIRSMIADPANWAAAWHALTLTGGVWLEAYTGSTLPVTPWPPELWLAWPRAFSAELARQGGRLDRLHFLMSSGASGDQPAQWALARTGTDPQSACALLADGPGAYRLSSVEGSAADFVVEYRKTFPAPGAAAIGCSPSPLLAPSVAAALGDSVAPGILSLEHLGLALPAGAIGGGPVTVGQTTSLTVTLPGGADPFGLAGRLAAAGVAGTADPATFWSLAQPRLSASGSGLSGASVPFVLGADGSWTATVTLSPTAPGPISLTLGLNGAAIRAALGPPADLALSLASYAAQDPLLGPTLKKLAVDPLSWRLAIPLGTAEQPLAAAVVAGNPAPALAALSPSGAVAGSGGVTLSVSGSGFVPGSTVRWNGADRPTTFVSSTNLTAAIPASDLGGVGTASVSVANPPPGGGVSAVLPFTVFPPPPPIPTVGPSVSGLARYGGLLSCAPGAWSGSPTALRFAWLRSGRPIAGARGRTYRVRAADLGRRLRCRVQATNLGGTGTAASAPLLVPVPRLHVLAARRVRRGRPLALVLRFDAPAPPVRLSVQSLVRGRFRTIASATTRAGRAAVRVRLSAGPHRLRVAYALAGAPRLTRPIAVVASSA